MNKKSKKSIVFIHDHCFSKDSNGDFYSPGQITDSTLSRFHPFARSVVILARVRFLDDAAGHVRINDRGVCIRPVKGERFSIIYGKFFFVNVLRIWRIIKDADFVILRMPCMLSFMVAPMLWARSIPYSVELVAFPRDGLMGKGRKPWIRALGVALHVLTRKLVASALGVLYVTENTLQRAYPTKAFSIGVSNVELSPRPASVASHNCWVLKEPVRIGLIGSMAAKYKGVDTAIEAISLLSRCGFNCRLHVLGSGDREHLERLAVELNCSEAVEFDGVREAGEGVLRWLSALDIYIQPSRTEGLPRALVEAMSCGLPAVATNVGGIPELLDPYWLVPSEDSEKLGQRISELIDNDRLRVAAGKANAWRAADFTAPLLRRRREWFYTMLVSKLDG